MGGQLVAASSGNGHGSQFVFTIPLNPSLSPITFRKSSGSPFSSLPNSIPSPRSSGCFPTLVLVIDPIAPRRKALCELLDILRVRHEAMNSVQELERVSSSSQASPKGPVTSKAGVVIVYAPERASAMAENERVIRQAHQLVKDDSKIIWVTTVKQSSKTPPSFASVANPSASSSSPPHSVLMTLPITLSKLKGLLKSNTRSSPRSPTVLTQGDQLIGFLDHPEVRTNQAPSPAPVPPAVVPFLETARVLVVDDVRANRRVLELKLRQNGCKLIEFATNGVEAVQIAKHSVDVFDFILMDVMMPEMDGITATRIIRQDPRYAWVPIIGITGNCAEGELERYVKECGMTAALGKPVDTQKLLALLSCHGPRRNPLVAGS